MEWVSIAGRKSKESLDYYQTPQWAVEELLKYEQFDGNILEPCSGSGSISKVLEKYGYQVDSFDIRNDIDIYGTRGIDFLKYEGKCNNIITNPPYNIAQAFIEKSIAVADRKIAMLLKLSFLESIKRYDMFKNTPFKTLYVFSKRVQMYPGGTGINNKKNGPIAFAWFVWEHGYKGSPFIDWFKP
jgi:Methylase of polypeptide chain release factors